ncbi:hypothetical protein IA57_05325 [Mangrovimonas yunxiaonensis]|uniref:Uncharacterized protein n=1 Tax=Mangrovimonas yunxiaonensis TaxID=1197477 RepID=A0A084TKL7_9FLAO|nr:hypothetical protein [Mangrovimonas yunxiaonensis]KFB01253.1 hypothetical protein IA57_05325 [Mangrovimonas yunxiaonensis]GGH37785.1 hypothetical protein GCM10011364_06040 [Mangrovimonas yunxiaonensis]
MSDKLPQQQNTSEEVDLGQLFNMIGNLFTKLFNFIGSVLYKLFLFFVGIILFVKKNSIILFIAAVIGFAYGYVKEKYSEPVYSSFSVIKQNYNTGESLYNLLNYYNDLISDNDTLALAQELNISPKDAGSIVSFEMESVLNMNNKLKVFDRFKKEIDSTIAGDIEFETFLENSYDYEYEFQRLTTKTTKKTLLRQILPNIIKNIEEIDYFIDVQQRDLTQLQNREQVILESLKESDSLQKVYERVLQKDQEGSSSQTSVLINNAKEESSTKEYELFTNDLKLRRELVEIKREKEDLSHILEVISSQQEQGIEDNNITLLGYDINKKIYYAILFFSLVFFVLISIKVIKFLERFREEINF